MGEQQVEVYGASISYFTGKLENYLRLKGIPYVLKPMRARGTVAGAVGTAQVPAVQLPDGRWMTDSTAMIDWFEAAYPAPEVVPRDPLQQFFSTMLEDYADEWLWRPAMHYRWHYRQGQRFAGGHLAAELGADLSYPRFVVERMITRRQRAGYTTGDGITAENVDGVEAIVFRTLDQLEAILGKRPFLLGTKPSLADVGFSGPFFRHFCLDPVPAAIVRERAPNVWAWSASLWAYGERAGGEWLNGVPDDWGPILDEVGRCYLPYLCANAEAIRAGAARFDAEIDGVAYTGARSSRYRVWCLKQLRDGFTALAAEDAAQARERLEAHGCWGPLWQTDPLPLEDGFNDRLPFYADGKMIEVYD